MAAPVYYVRTSGSDSNSGLSAGSAWKTVNHALSANGASVSGASVYVGAGVYRQTIAVGVSGAAGSVTAIIGDVDGAQTGDAGQVTLTGFTTNDTTAPSSTILLAIGTHTNLSFSLLTFIGGSNSTGVITSTAATSAANLTFTDCVINAMYGGTSNMGCSFVSSTTGLPLSVTIDRCTILAGTNCINISLATTNTGSSDWDALTTIRNCLLIPGGNYAINVVATGTNNWRGGGVRAYNCTIPAAAFDGGMTTATAAHLSASVSCECHGSIIQGGIGLSAATSGQIIESYNLFYCGTARSNVSAGPGSIAGTYAPLVELGQSYKWGDGTIRQFLAPDGTQSPLLGFGSSASVAASVSGTVDWQNRPRPAGGGGAVPIGVASVQSVGYMEYHDAAAQSTTTFPVGQTSSGQLTGPGDQDLLVPVDAVATVIAIQLNQGSGYGGTNYATATLLAEGELGVASQVQTCSSTTGSWQTLTFSSITPSKQGWVRVRIASYDTTGTATLNFGALT